MKCSHCLVEFHSSISIKAIGNDVDGLWEIHSQTCPACKRDIYQLHNYQYRSVKDGFDKKNTVSLSLIRPKTTNRAPVPIEVPDEYAVDYKEACLVLTDSPKASAALSRRCLQHIIRGKLGVQKSDLYREIQEVIDRSMLSTELLESIDAIRNVGNFAAHPIKSTSTGEIVEVEPHEAEWNLDVIEELFEYLFVRPEAIQKRKDALNAKLVDAGKNHML